MFIKRFTIDDRRACSIKLNTMLMSKEKIVRIYNSGLKKVTNVRVMKRMDVGAYFRSTRNNKVSACCKSPFEASRIKNKKDPRSDIKICSRCKKQVTKFIELKRKEYCERCGRRIGKKFQCKKPIMWKGFILCDCCYDDKITGRPETTPDLEDLKRFNVEL